MPRPAVREGTGPSKAAHYRKRSGKNKLSLTYAVPSPKPGQASELRSFLELQPAIVPVRKDPIQCRTDSSMSPATAFYIKVAGLCFVVRHWVPPRHTMHVALCQGLSDFDLCHSQVGGCMEGFMIKTGFYDKYIS